MNSDANADKWLELIKKAYKSSLFYAQDFYKLIKEFSADSFAVEEENYKSHMVVTIQKEKGDKGYWNKKAKKFYQEL